MIYDASLDELLQKVWEGKRINQSEALRLYHLPLEELGALADRRRQLAKVKDFDGRGNDIITYIVDRNVNYTNVCNVYCKFCAFYRVEKDDDAYVISFDEMDKKIEETIALGPGPIGFTNFSDDPMGARRANDSAIFYYFDEHQPAVSNLIRGRITQVSIEKLLRYSDRLGMRARLKVLPASKASTAA